MSLQVYQDNGFKFFRCRANKKPKVKWTDTENHLTIDIARTLQKTGEMIGAWIPEDIIIIDLDRHPGKSDGVKTFCEIKKKYHIDYGLTSETFCVQTGAHGYHIFLYVGKNHGYTSKGSIAPGIDLKANVGYVIASGSPGYQVHPSVINLDIMEIPPTLKIWLDSIVWKKTEQAAVVRNQKNIPINLMEKIFKKLDIKKFNDNEKWYNIIVSAIAAAGNNDEITELLSTWSAGDSRYSEKEATKRIKSFESEGGITIGTFVHILRENAISQYFIKKILSYNTAIELYQNMRDDGESLPFPEPNYEEISDSKEAEEFFLTAGNSAAATLLGFATINHILWCEADKNFYFFDNNKWTEFYDMYSVAYTILIRLIKFMFAKKKNTGTDNETFLKLVKIINRTNWKKDTIRELQCRDGIYNKHANWDSEKLKETITTKDGVIDFSENNIIIRKGERKEFRKSYVSYVTSEIMEAQEPVKFNHFLSTLFPDPDTLFTARQSSSMFISGNAKKVFQIFHGNGDNGKTTWIEIEKELIGEKAHTYSTSLILNNKYGDDRLPPEVADFMGKYLLFGSEIQKGKQLSLGKIKNFTGDDTIAATPKYKDQREFRPTWQMILSVNDLPFFDGTDRAFINRLLILPFEKTFVDSESEKNKLIKNGYDEKMISLKIDSDKLKKEIRQEFPGIIKQKINDYMQLKKNHNGIICQSEKCKNHKDAYISENNDIENFINEMCIVSITEKFFTSTEDMTAAYHNFTGSGNATDSYVSRSIKKNRREVQSVTKIITENRNTPHSDHDIRTVKVQRRGLSNIRLKTINEIEIDINYNKTHDDKIPF